MKKIFYSFLCLAAFSFAACEDVPMPYGQPGTETTDPTDPDTPVAGAEGDGTIENPYNIAAAVAQNNPATTACVKGYIVGYVSGMTLSTGAVFTSDTCTVATNLLIAATPDETATANCMTVQLPSGAVRTGVNLKDNKANIKQPIVLFGSLEKYFGASGIKSVTWAKVGDVEFGTKPGEGGGEVVGTPSGTGTEADPYNVAMAQQVIKNGPSTEAVYVKGKISEISNIDTGSYGNAEYSISDDGTTAGQLLVYRGYYLGKAKFTAADQIKVGDDVVIKGVLVNYNNTKPEVTSGSEIVLHNGKKADTGGDDQGDDQPGTGDVTESNGNFEAWTDGQPNCWKSACTASNATLSQSTDAHGGSYSVCVAGSASGNKRLGYKELDLKAGTYNVVFYVKAATTDGGSARPGYVPVADGKVGNYVYGDYVNDLTNTQWTKVTYSFTLDADATVCLVVMNSKNPGKDILIDDFSLTLGDTAIIK